MTATAELPVIDWSFTPLDMALYPGEPFRLIVTGARGWPESHAGYIEAKLARHIAQADISTDRAIIVVHGACPFGGADLWAHRWCDPEWGTVPEPHPAEYNHRGMILGPQRNMKMIKLGANMCVGFPAPGSRGTTHCMRKAREAGILTFEHQWEDAIRGM